MSGFVMKGALVEFMPTFLPVPLPNVIVFQYNPETMTHTWTQPEAAAGGAGGTETSNPLAVQGHARGIVLLHHRHGRKRRDRRRQPADGGDRPSERDLHPPGRARDAALPDGDDQRGCVGTVSAAISLRARAAAAPRRQRRSPNR